MDKIKIENRGDVLQIICSAAARKLKLDMMPGSWVILQNRYNFARKLGKEKRGKNFQNFFHSRAEHILILPGSLKGKGSKFYTNTFLQNTSKCFRKSRKKKNRSNIFEIFLQNIFLICQGRFCEHFLVQNTSKTSSGFARSEVTWEHMFSMCCPLSAFVFRSW